MEYDYETGKQLIDELLDLWNICQDKCDKIEKIVKELEQRQHSFSK